MLTVCMWFFFHGPLFILGMFATSVFKVYLDILVNLLDDRIVVVPLVPLSGGSKKWCQCKHGGEWLYFDLWAGGLLNVLS